MPQRSFSSSRGLRAVSVAAFGIALAVLGGMAIAAQDKYTLQVPNGLAFSEFKGYEAWQTVSLSQNEKAVAVILANPAMIKAYQSGIPGNGKPFPDGSKMAEGFPSVTMKICLLAPPFRFRSWRASCSPARVLVWNGPTETNGSS